MDDLPDLPDFPLRPELPVPPICHIGGVRHVLERVRIEDLETWARERGLVHVGTASLGQPGWYEGPGGVMRRKGWGAVSVYGAKDGAEGNERDDQFRRWLE
jgi:hypothetical protein